MRYARSSRHQANSAIIGDRCRALISAGLLVLLPVVANASEADPDLDADPIATLATAATASAATPDAHAVSASSAALRAEADLSAASAMVSLKDATTDQQQAVAAALAFAHALKLYQRLGDSDRVTEMQAQLFWCRKNMGVDALAALAAQNGGQGSGADVTAFVGSGTVLDSEATNAFASAEAFRADHPADHEVDALRFDAVVAWFGAATSPTAKAVVAKATTIADEERGLAASARQVDASTDAGDAQAKAGPATDVPITDARSSAPGSVSGDASSSTDPLADAKSQWSARLYARVRETIARNRPPCFTSSVVHQDLEIDAADAAGNLVLRSGDATINWAWKRISDGDRVSLALGVVRDANPGDHCIAAFYLFLAGKHREAERQLLGVGAPGDAVRALFQPGPR